MMLLLGQKNSLLILIFVIYDFFLTFPQVFLLQCHLNFFLTNLMLINLCFVRESSLINENPIHLPCCNLETRVRMMMCCLILFGKFRLNFLLRFLHFLRNARNLIELIPFLIANVHVLLLLFFVLDSFGSLRRRFFVYVYVLLLFCAFLPPFFCGFCRSLACCLEELNRNIRLSLVLLLLMARLIPFFFLFDIFKVSKLIIIYDFYYFNYFNLIFIIIFNDFYFNDFNLIFNDFYYIFLF